MSWPREDLLNLGLFILSFKGGGKSRLMGRLLCFQNLWQAQPQVIIDGAGGLVDNLIHCVLLQPPAQRRVLLSRLVYFDMSGKLTGHLCPLPLFYRFGHERWSDVAQRFIEAILTLDTNLQTASVQGANAIRRLGLPANMALASLGAQITEMSTLLDQPKVYKTRLKQLAREAEDQGLREAARFFVEQYLGWDSKRRAQESLSYRGKVDLLLRDNASRAMFGADYPGFAMQDLEDRGYTVILDFRGDQDNQALLQFKMYWAFDYLFNYVKYRGAGMEQQSIGLVIDEISMLANFDGQTENAPFTKQIDALLNIWSRQGKVNVCVATQEMHQLPTGLFKTLMGCGTVCCGLTSDMEAARTIADAIWPAVDPEERVKRYDPILGSDGQVVGQRRIDLSLEELIDHNARLIKNQPKFHFLVKEIDRDAVYDLDFSGLEPGIYPDEQAVRMARQLLSRRWGQPIDQLLAQIEARQDSLSSAGSPPAPKKPAPVRPMQPVAPSATLKDEGDLTDDPIQPTQGDTNDAFEDLWN